MPKETKKPVKVKVKNWKPCEHKRVFKLEMFLTVEQNGKKTINTELARCCEIETVLELLKKYVKEHTRKSK